MHLTTLPRRILWQKIYDKLQLFKILQIRVQVETHHSGLVLIRKDYSNTDVFWLLFDNLTPTEYQRLEQQIRIKTNNARFTLPKYQYPPSRYPFRLAIYERLTMQQLFSAYADAFL